MIPTIAAIIDRIKTNKTALGITLYNGASEHDIKTFEETMNTRLPEDIKTFYRCCNGFESEEDLFRIIPLDEIIERGKDSYLVNNGDFHFAEYMIYCDMWSLSVNTSDNSYFIYNSADDIVTLTSSFAVFLNRFLDGGVFEGLYDWRTEISQAKNK